MLGVSSEMGRCVVYRLQISLKKSPRCPVQRAEEILYFVTENYSFQIFRTISLILRNFSYRFVPFQSQVGVSRCFNFYKSTDTEDSTSIGNTSIRFRVNYTVNFLISYGLDDD